MKVLETPQNESTPFYPRSPYAVAKLYAYWIASTTAKHTACLYRMGSSLIMRVHDMARLSKSKIVNAIAKIQVGQQQKLILGNLDAKRDRGHAKISFGACG